ncbi:proteasome regulatory particle base subunit [Mortierella hygrophila]|uniref:Dolichyl-diphosphooligosaccharide--protein glycosyltransferase subunit 1 n=1 Tax=Mortierella hygrophila TaxID=979708 RepID=A0A9P6F1B5_9FUNG|nr:proteasome regulatory particle base subunit [Mortierella hygrophila]
MRLTTTTTALVATIIAALSLTSSVHAEEFWSEKDVSIVPQTFKITNLLRTLDLSKPIIREITSAAVLNTHADQDQTDYYFPVDHAYSDNLAFISAENRKTKEVLEVTKDEEFYDPQFQYYKIKLATPLPPGEKVQITVRTSLTNIIRAFPTHVGQAEKQKFVFFGNPFALTAYPATKQKTTVITPNSVLEVHEHPEEVDLVIKNNQVILGPYNDVSSLEHGIFEVQYELSGAIPHIRSLRREIEVSQWGNNLAVEEHYNFVNRGAELKGQFSRIDYQRNPMGVREGNGALGFQTMIPKLARDIYYRDEIGNISTSVIAHHPDHIQLMLKPRFPLFGGWNTTWYIGYNTPLDGYLRKIAGTDKHILKVPVISPMPDTTYEDVEIRIVLPEGAKNVKAVLPYEVDDIEYSTTKTYMDSAGRSTVTILASNLIEDHAQDLFIEYEFSQMSYLTKPLAAATMLMAIYATSIVFSRLDFKIGGSTLKKQK